MDWNGAPNSFTKTESIGYIIVMISIALMIVGAGICAIYL